MAWASIGVISILVNNSVEKTMVIIDKKGVVELNEILHM